MKKVILGVGIGIGIICLVRKMYNDGHLDCCCDEVDKFLSKSKRNIRIAADAAKHEAEYIKERVEDTLGKK